MFRFLPIVNLILVFACCATQAGEIDFELQIRPLLIDRCSECHGADEQNGGLRLDARSFAFKGGDSGNAIVPGKIDSSELVRRIASGDTDERMPPDEALSENEISRLMRWIDAGANWPESAYDRAALHDPRLEHWAFQPQLNAVVHTTRKQSLQSIDLLIRRKLAENGLAPAPQANRRILLRRVSFDLLGLPPSVQDVRDFETDNDPDAWEVVVDRILDSPRYGERWAQHWLDVIRYADTHGFEVNTPRENAWPYRDYVIRSFNDDKPYDQFIREQLAGDAFQVDEATGFMVAAAVLLPGQIGKDEESKRLARQDALDEMIQGTAATLLGLTIGCARCHDHKFDPISQHDYYAMQAFFAGVDYGDRPLRNAQNEELEEQSEKKDKLEASRMVYGGTFRKPDATFVLRRGDPEQPIRKIGPAFPALFNIADLAADLPEQKRRLLLADWIASPDNTLTARVMVNRIWLYHFGQGIVATPSDFGLNGARPTHPDLLDWLAGEFIRSGWSIKHIHRLILTSHTYRQSHRIDPKYETIDRDNKWLWRFPSRRLEGEAIRDSMLVMSGELNSKMGGPGFDFFASRGGLSGFPPVSDFASEQLRRMIYSHKIRMERVPVFGAFDCPDAGQAMPLRSRSTTAIQALNLFNSRFVADRSDKFAERISADNLESLDAEVVRVFEFALARKPTNSELRAALAVASQHGLATVCRVLFNCNEFLFIP